MGEIQKVIWDLDGTLLDSFGVYIEVLGDILPAHGLMLPAVDLLHRNFHGSLMEGVNNSLGGNLDAQLLMDLETHFIEAQEEHYVDVESHLFQDAVRLARRVHENGAGQLLVTNRDHARRPNASPRSIVANTELKNYIDIIICGDDSEHRKPKSNVLGKYQQTIDPDKTLVIGDQFVDALFAYNLGCRAVLVSRNGDRPPNLDQLAHDWQSHVTIVDSLDAVELYVERQ